MGLSTGDQSGKLRLVREIIGSDSIVTGYYFSNQNNSWVPIHSRTWINNVDDLYLSMQVWTDTGYFTNRVVEMAFDNIIIRNY